MGVGSGATLEAVHTAIKFVGQGGITDSFVPLFAADHVAAIVGWVCFYVLDVIAIKAVLDAYKGDEQSAGQALKNLVTLPKKMLPLRLAVFKHLMNLSNENAIVAAPLPPTSTTAAPGATRGLFIGAPTKPSNAGNPTVLPLPQPQAPKATQNIVPTTPPVTKRRTADITKPSTVPGSNAMPKGPAKHAEILSDIRSRQGLVPGQMDPSIAAALATRQKELRDRRGYLYNFWYAAGTSEQLKNGELLKVEILSKQVVLFRDSATGAVKVLEDVCPHRGAPFSKGWA